MAVRQLTHALRRADVRLRKVQHGHAVLERDTVHGGGVNLDGSVFHGHACLRQEFRLNMHPKSPHDAERRDLDSLPPLSSTRNNRASLDVDGCAAIQAMDKSHVLCSQKDVAHRRYRHAVGPL